MNPLFKWAGSKRKLIPSLRKYWRKDFGTYIEPFAGSAALFFALLPNKAILSDSNSELIQTYIQIKNNHVNVAQCLQNLKNSEIDYYKIRSTNIDSLLPEERAARFIYLNSLCFNGLYRTNKQGKFNVPYGKEVNKKLPSISVLQRYSDSIQNASFYDFDFSRILNMAKPGDFIYLDPPYRIKGKKTFIQYGPREFRDDDIKTIKTRLCDYSKNNISFILSYVESEEANELSEGFFSEKISVVRNISGFSKARIKVNEVIITNICQDS